jgi:hypothetical protein
MLKEYTKADTATLLQVISNQQETIDKLTERLDKLLRLLYGTKNERRKTPIDVTQEKPVVVIPKNAQETDKRNGRRPLPIDLPRVRIEYDLQGEQQYCSCGYKMQQIGKVVTEQLDCKPMEFFVKEHVRYKYACRCCNQIGILSRKLRNKINFPCYSRIELTTD